MLYSRPHRKANLNFLFPQKCLSAVVKFESLSPALFGEQCFHTRKTIGLGARRPRIAALPLTRFVLVLSLFEALIFYL